MKTAKKCAFCGSEFTANSGMQKYCSISCADKAKKERKKRNEDFLKAAEPVIGLREQEYLTFSKAAILMGCSRQYIYKLVSQGPYTLRLCRLVAGKQTVPLWNNGWLAKELTTGIPYETVVNCETLKKVTPVITFRETRMYNEFYK